MDIESLLEKIRSGDRIALGRAITLVESTLDSDQEMTRQLLKHLLHQKKALKVAVSGSPGVGKSTFIDQLGSHFTGAGFKVAVLAIDPSSLQSQGSILGDKTRMLKLGKDVNAFIRPSPTQGLLGGIGRATFEASLLCEEAGFDFIIIETVGVGQSEIMARHLSDIFILLMQPGAGDELQGIKKGIIENADLLLVNKWDGDQKLIAEKTKAAFDGVWPADKSNILLISAAEDLGIDTLSEELISIKEKIDLDLNARERAAYWFVYQIRNLLMKRLLQKEGYVLQELENRIEEGNLHYSEAIEQALKKICL
ncbi:MAG: ATP/GTP-binding protein [Saprospiraceae bacterium]|nr:ATP/GTP-binding protein [Saprospiraceae bacterium]